MPKICNRIIKRMVIFALFIVYTYNQAAFAVETDSDGPYYRALLIACDEFVTATNMTPSGANNLAIMESIIEQDVRGFEIQRQYGITFSKEALAFAIEQTFGDAKEGDVSLLYISTHGDFDTSHNNPTGELLLSDGSLEGRITAFELNEILDKIEGTKVMLVDACNSGALIGKGVSPAVGSARVMPTFQSGDYKILTSSGASEPSWYVLPTIAQAPPGSSYFTTAMAIGAGLIGGYAADINRDGIISLKEMYNHLWVNQASSVAQIYPQDDSFPLFVYDKAALDNDTHGELTGFVFGSTILDAENPVLSFEYTATAATRVAYRITYLRAGEWDWLKGETLRDATEWDGDMDPMGDISPGRKQISLDLTDILPEGWTYAMVHVMTLGDEAEGKQPFIYASRVFSAQQNGADPQLSIRSSLQWNQKYRQELEIFVAHAIPCNLTVEVHDAEGKLVRRLTTSRSTRPQSLSPNGSLFYWNGLDNHDSPVPAGSYTIEARVAGTAYTASWDFVIEPQE